MFMQGRYGTDELSRFAIIVSIVLIIISYVFYIPLLYILGIALSLWSLWRTYSKNIAKRMKERQWFLSKKQKITGRFASHKKISATKKTHRLFKCKKCKTVLRVPKGVGKIKITCSKCGNTMIKRA